MFDTRKEGWVFVGLGVHYWLTIVATDKIINKQVNLVKKS